MALFPSKIQTCPEITTETDWHDGMKNADVEVGLKLALLLFAEVLKSTSVKQSLQLVSLHVCGKSWLFQH